eukprot:EG_transcript_11808
MALAGQHSPPAQGSPKGPLVTAQTRVVALQEQVTALEREKFALLAQTAELERLLADRTQAVGDLHGRLRDVEAECQALRDAHRQAEHQARAEVARLQQQVDALQHDLAKAQATIGRGQSHSEGLERQAAVLGRQVQVAEEALQRSHREVQELEARLEKADRQHQKRAAEQMAEITKLLSAVESLNAELRLAKSLPLGQALFQGGTAAQDPPRRDQPLDRLDSPGRQRGLDRTTRELLATASTYPPTKGRAMPSDRRSRTPSGSCTRGTYAPDLALPKPSNQVSHIPLYRTSPAVGRHIAGNRLALVMNERPGGRYFCPIDSDEPANANPRITYRRAASRDDLHRDSETARLRRRGVSSSRP